MSSNLQKSKVTTLVLDAGPLLSLTPLRGLAEHYITAPQVLEELRDKKAREHFEQLGLTAGVKVEVRSPDAEALAQVSTMAKKTGDYVVLSKADLCILALTYAVNQEDKAKELLPTAEASAPLEATASTSGTSNDETPAEITQKLDCLSLENEESQSKVQILDEQIAEQSQSDSDHSDPLFEDHSDEDDGEGEWITPENVAIHKSRALDLLPVDEDEQKKARKKGKATSPLEPEHIAVGCMTADFAMQNVLMHMGLHLVGVGGKRIARVKTWVLRCHGCFKICKDPSKKFCPSCGGPTLLRTAVTVSAPTTPGGQPTMQVHLKKNFQWRNRGTKFSIPAPKPGSAKTGTGEGLILREDQTEWIKAEKRAEFLRQKEEKKMIKAIGTSTGNGVKLDWMDPDWMPEMLTVGAGGKGRTTGRGDMPMVGYGRKNPNERRRKN